MNTQQETNKAFEVPDWASTTNRTVRAHTEALLAALLLSNLKLATLREFASDIMPCGHHRDAMAGDGLTHWCSECEREGRLTGAEDG